MSLQIDDWGVRRLDASGEAVAWADLIGVEILTTDEGPFNEDLFWLLEGADGKGVVVSGGLAQESGLLAVLQERLPDFDNDAVVRAAGSIEPARFTAWRRSG